jgi:hypothetical protein
VVIHFPGIVDDHQSADHPSRVSPFFIHGACSFRIVGAAASDVSTALVVQSAACSEKRIYGAGSLTKIGNTWHVRYYDAAGIRRSESTGTDDEAKAERFRQKRLGQIAASQNVEPKKNVGAIAKAYFAHLEVKSAAVDQDHPAPTQAWRAKTKKRNYRLQPRRWELHLEDHFAGARKVLSNHPDEYITRKEEAKDATIQRKVSLLQKILNHANVQDLPKFPRLAESLPRQGFAEDAQFEQLCGITS